MVPICMEKRGSEQAVVLFAAEDFRNGEQKSFGEARVAEADERTKGREHNNQQGADGRRLVHGLCYSYNNSILFLEMQLFDVPSDVICAGHGWAQIAKLRADRGRGCGGGDANHGLLLGPNGLSF